MLAQLKGLSRRVIGGLSLFVLSASAWAQDYVVTKPAGSMEARPASATAQTAVTSSGSQTVGVGVTITLPFPFPYYTTIVQQITIAPYGYILPRAVAAIPTNSGNHGEAAVGLPFPFLPTNSGGAGSNSWDGMIAPCLCASMRINDSFSTGLVYTWTTGTAPTRHFVIAWEGLQSMNGATAVGNAFTFQVHLYEGTGRIVFANGSVWGGTVGSIAYPNGYICGIDSPIDGRYHAPVTVQNGGNQTQGLFPGSNFVFDPVVTTYTGALLYDKIVSDATGIGNSVQGNVPIRQSRVELRRNSDGFVYAATTTGDDGSFSLTDVGLPGTASGTLAVLAQNAACSVSTTSLAATTAWTVNGSLSFASSANLGALTLGVGGDANGDVRAALNVARDCLAARDWASARTTDSIPQLAVLLDPAKPDATSYAPVNGSVAASLRIASRAATNPDAWDDAMVTKAYGRHVLASIAGASTTAYDDRFDAVTDPTNAFADAFGSYLWAVVSGTSTAIDGTSASTAVVQDVEHPTVTVAKGPDVAGCVAGALYDLVDSANETGDPIDGTLTADRPFHVADSLTAAPTAATFLQAWVDAGFDAPGVTRVFIANGALVDDEFEPNDTSSEAATLGTVPFVHPGLVLNRFNEDWFTVTLPADASALAIDIGSGVASTIAVEIRDPADAVIATGNFISARGVVNARTGPVAAGNYKVHARYVSGAAVQGYTFQAYLPPSMDPSPIHDWTVGQPYDLPLGVRDGLAPYVLSTPNSFMPPGMGLNSSTLHASGVPSTVGAFSVTVGFHDSGDPTNIVTRTQTVTIHDVFKFPIAPFVGFPAGKSLDATFPTHEGTPPFTLTMSSGALTPGLALAPNSLHVTGTATAGPSSAFELDGVDVAGSADHVATRAVVAVEITGKKIAADLAAGVDACGWWFDAVEGSIVTFAVATSKGMPKRALTGAFLAPDRSLVATGKFVVRLGGVSASKLVCPTSGRYYFVASTTDTGLATQLLGTATIKLPRAGKGLDKAFKPSATTTIEFGAVPGSTATVKFAGDKKATLIAKVVAVYSPTGAKVSTAGLIKPTATGGTLKMPLDTGGTWTIVIGAASQSGIPGKLSYSYSVAQKKGAAYSAD
jgi:hypothetical protein